MSKGLEESLVSLEDWLIKENQFPVWKQLNFPAQIAQNLDLKISLMKVAAVWLIWTTVC